MPSGSNTDKDIFRPRYPNQKLRFVNFRKATRLDLEFFWEALKGLWPLQHRFNKRIEEGAGLTLSRQFFGCCLAVPKDYEQCQRVLDLVSDSGLGSVRLDLGYGQNFEQAIVLAKGLKEAEVSVLLHLVPSMDSGSQFPKSEATQAWIQFLQKCDRKFEGLFDAWEVGTTINRANWSGVNLKGFLSMWQVAHEFCERSSIILVGPNVTDFEPQYNAGVMGMLKRRNLLPQIHSNNLFAERAVEPEDADHKIMGFALRNLHGYDLRKKIALIASIAKRNGIARNWSTCAFWTIPRLHRLTEYSEEQMADYLVRYLVLCASVGSFERVLWGPLVSYREGLLDDGTGDRSSSDGRDVVAFYSAYTGKPNNWRVRPAFKALRAIAKQLEGYRFVSTLASHRGLEMHQFEKLEETCIVAWTKDGSLARVSNCFRANSLEKIVASYDRDGNKLDNIPDFITQSPSIFYWSSGYTPDVYDSAAQMSQVVGMRPPEGLDFFNFETDNWRGILLVSSRAEADKLCKSLQPEAISSITEHTSLRKSRNAIWTVSDPRNANKKLVAKKPLRISWHKRILDRKKPSKALRSWNGTCELMRRGINTPSAVAYFESKRPRDIMENWFVCEHVEGAVSVRCFFSKYAAGETVVEGIKFSEFSEKLVDFVIRMHRTRIFFRDLAGGNILVTFTENMELKFTLIDTARIKCESRGLKLRHIVQDLKRLCLKLNPDQQRDFMQEYLSRVGLRFTKLQSLSFKLFAIKVKLKRCKRNLMKKLR